MSADPPKHNASRRRLVFLLLIVAGALVASGGAAAHTVHGGCGKSIALMYDYFVYLIDDPTNPDRITSGVVYVGGPTCSDYWRCDGDGCALLPIGG
ncbi:MAG: hypothetical protein HY556_07265 [Euryarchaeota archaeon]|nr:hypothetical protein [Euryarchaeota archaeon]